MSILQSIRDWISETGIGRTDTSEPEPDRYIPDFSEVRGQQLVKRAVEVAVAGGHNILMIGPPGSGKSMLAKRAPSILPPLTQQDLIETQAMYAISGQSYFDTQPPYQSPHHTTSYAALIGGGSSRPRPGMISLAHNGVLFLDELPEFNRRTLESLRQPLEEEKVTVSRTNGTAVYPARFMLIAAMNPCPCGYYPKCQCKPEAVQKYRSRVSGPLLDRIDLHVEVPAVTIDTLQLPPDETSETVRARVIGARWRQYVRSGKLNTNLEIGNFEASDIHNLIQATSATVPLSARGYVRILRVARTIADLSASDHITENHILEAVSYRLFNK